MDEENDIQDDEVQHEEGQGHEPADQNPPPVELPDDPAEVRRVAEKLAADAHDLKQRNRTLKDENERLGTNYQEQKAKADYAVSLNQRLKGELEQGGKPAGTGNGAQPSKEKQPIAASLRKKDMAEYVADEEGAVKYAEDITESVILPAVRQLIRTEIDQEKRAASEETLRFQELGKRHPELAKGDTPLAEKTYEMLESVAEEFPNVPRAAQMEIAASRAKIALEKNPPKTSQPRANGGNRLTNAQGGPVATGRSGGGGGVHVEVTDADRRQWAKMSGGVPIKDSEILAAKREAAESNARRQSR